MEFSSHTVTLVRHFQIDCIGFFSNESRIMSFLANYTDLIHVESKMNLLLGLPSEQLYQHYCWNSVLTYKRNHTRCELVLVLKSKQK